MAEIQPKMPPFTWLDSMMSVCYSVSEREVTLIPGIKGHNAVLKLHFVSLNLVFKSYAVGTARFREANAAQSRNSNVKKNTCLTDSFPHLRMCIQPFVYGHFFAFSTRTKK